MAECHPVAFQWVVEAKARGAKVIHVDPRFTRTSALADVYVPIRAGSDIVFLGAIINHVLENERNFREYVVRYTNAPMIIDERFADTGHVARIVAEYRRLGFVTAIDDFGTGYSSLSYVQQLPITKLRLQMYRLRLRNTKT